MRRLLAALLFSIAGALAASAAPCDNLPGSAFKGQSRGMAWEQQVEKAWAHVPPGAEGFVLGDSIVSRYPRKDLDKVAFYGVDRFGVAGDGIENLIWRLKHYPLAKTRSAYIVVIIGGEDVATMQPDVLADKIAAATCIIQAKYSRVFRYPRSIQVVSLLPQGKDLERHLKEIRAVNVLLRDQAKRFDYTYINVFKAFRDECVGGRACPLYADAYNLSARGYDLLTDLIAR